MVTMVTDYDDNDDNCGSIYLLVMDVLFDKNDNGTHSSTRRLWMGSTNS